MKRTFFYKGWWISLAAGFIIGLIITFTTQQTSNPWIIVGALLLACSIAVATLVR